MDEAVGGPIPANWPLYQAVHEIAQLPTRIANNTREYLQDQQSKVD